MTQKDLESPPDFRQTSLPLFFFPCCPLFKTAESKYGLPVFTVTNQRLCGYLEQAMRGSMTEEHAQAQHMHS